MSFFIFKLVINHYSVFSRVNVLQGSTGYILNDIEIILQVLGIDLLPIGLVSQEQCVWSQFTDAQSLEGQIIHTLHSYNTFNEMDPFRIGSELNKTFIQIRCPLNCFFSDEMKPNIFVTQIICELYTCRRTCVPIRSVGVTTALQKALILRLSNHL